MQKLLPTLFLLTSAFASPDSSIRLSSAQAREIGLKLWQNEAGGKVELLTFWNKDEEFPSLGIGHFIWYPEGRKGPFTESFPDVLDAIAASGVELPQWLKGKPACPWPNREAFYAEINGPRLAELRSLLEKTIDVQALHAARRLEGALPKILAAADPSERETLARRFQAVAAVPSGVYALVDYVNFKGEGTNPTERYDSLGWGLLQALQLMGDPSPDQSPVETFAHGAEAALTRRVEHAPAERKERETKFLVNWRKRLQTYR